MNRRDKTGTAVAFALGLLLGGIGTIIMVLRELWQSKKHGFEIETADVVRYSLVSASASIVNLIIILTIIC